MSFAEGKEFVLKHVFTGPWDTKFGRTIYSNKENHFNVPWRIEVFDGNINAVVRLECMKFRGSKKWSIDAQVNVKIFNEAEEESTFVKNVFTQNTETVTLKALKIIEKEKIENYLVDGNLTVELHVKVDNMSGIRMGKLRSFEDESAKELSDVVLIVNDEKFYVLKMYLASHSAYFKVLFLGSFSESQNSEIELKDIDPYDFQNFLELIHAESEVDDDTVEGISRLADMYDSKTALRKCDDFLIEKSERSLTVKFNLANKYKLEKLKKKCMSEIKTADDIRSVMPADSSEIDHVVWKQLLNKCLQLVPKKH